MAKHKIDEAREERIQMEASEFLAELSRVDGRIIEKIEGDPI
jgi:hypothetical protein